MAIALADSLVTARGYDPSGAVAQYTAWANSRSPFMGKNTRALFHGIKTLKGYQTRRSSTRRGLPRGASRTAA